MLVYKLADNIRLVQKETGDYLEDVINLQKYEIRGSAGYVLSLMDGKRDMDEILEEMCKLYGASENPYNIAKDLGDFILDLFEAKMIEVVR